MDLIYSCVFFQDKYIYLINLLLKSFIIYGKSNTKYLIITNESFVSKIQSIFDTLNINGSIWSLNLNSKFEAGYSRLKIFDYPEINNYNKILYLDCDVLVANKVENILNLTLEDKLYGLKEGNTNHIHWGSQFFENNPNISGFTSGVLLFNNSLLMKNLFKNILTHIESYINNNLPVPECLDQPFIVYHSILNNLYNNELLINIVINNPAEYNGETILHFPGNPGDYEDKIIKMAKYMNYMLYNISTLNNLNKIKVDLKYYNQIIRENNYIFEQLNNICKSIGEPIEGNCFTQHLNIDNRIDELIYKRLNHFSLGSISDNIMEIGFNAGHSSAIYLISNPNAKITIFDLCEHKYTMPCFEYLSSIFPNRLRIYPGDSTKTIPLFIENNNNSNKNKIEQFDLIHIDGCHLTEIANQDFYNSYKLAKNIIIWDDTQIIELNSLFNNYIKEGLIHEILLYETKIYEHKICNVNYLNNTKYSWGNNEINFLKNYQMEAFGNGNYKYIDIYTVEANFGGRSHILKFNKDYSKYISIRKEDFEVICGNTLENKNIPKIIFQTSVSKPESYIVDIIKKYCINYEYYHFNDSEIINYFQNNPLKNFPNIIDKFNSFTKGQHKADLFRYYYLYINGGIFIDSDAILEKNIEYIIQNYDSVFVKSFMENNYIFNGFIATYPKNEIIYKALLHAYNTSNIILNYNYYYFCEELWKIINNNNNKNNLYIKIYQEINKSNELYGGSIILNDYNEKILSHYWETKIIPKITKITFNNNISFSLIKRINTKPFSIFYSFIYDKFTNSIIGFGRNNIIKAENSEIWDRKVIEVSLSDNFEILNYKEPLIIGDDPRCFYHNNEIYIQDNWLNDVTLYNYNKKIYTRINIDGKNLSFISHNNELYFIYWMCPFILYKVNLENGNCIKINTYSDHNIITNNNDEYRGGTPGYSENKNIYYGYGHKTYTQNGLLIHDIYKWILKFENIPSLEIININQPLSSKNITDPTCVLIINNNKYLVTAETDYTWFNPNQDFITNIYLINDNKDNLTEEFTKIYDTNFWINGSGSGSYIENTKIYNEKIIDFIKYNNIKTITDIGCGDWQSSYLIYEKLENIDYLGIDCVQSVVNNNIKNHQNQYENKNYSFKALNILNELDSIRNSDLYILKDILQHWKLSDIYKLLDTLITKNFKYIIITNNAEQYNDNLELDHYLGIGRGLHSNYLPLKKYNPIPLFDYYGDENKHVCMIYNYSNILTTWNHYKKDEINNFMYNILTTYKVPNNLIRIGPQEDGGYVIVDNINYDLFISCGIANDVRFEESFLDIHKIKCIAFDGTIESFPLYRNNMEWIKKNIGYINTPNITNLKEYIENKSNIFLKMDIEGSEFNWLDSMSIGDLNKFNQIIMEVHWPFDTYRANMLNKLNNTHYLVHIHGNNYCDRDIPKHLPSGRTYDGTVTINNNLGIITLPEVFEVTYIKKSLFNNIDVNPIKINFPTILDFPNNPNAPDINFNIPILET